MSHSQSGAEGTRTLAPGSRKLQSSMPRSACNSFVIIAAVQVFIGAGKIKVSSANGMISPAVRLAGTFNNGESGDKRWNDSTMKNTNTASIQSEMTKISPNSMIPRHGTVTT